MILPSPNQRPRPAPAGAAAAAAPTAAHTAATLEREVYLAAKAKDVPRMQTLLQQSSEMSSHPLFPTVVLHDKQAGDKPWRWTHFAVPSSARA